MSPQLAKTEEALLVRPAAVPPASTTLQPPPVSLVEYLLHPSSDASTPTDGLV